MPFRIFVPSSIRDSNVTITQLSQAPLAWSYWELTDITLYAQRLLSVISTGQKPVNSL